MSYTGGEYSRGTIAFVVFVIVIIIVLLMVYWDDIFDTATDGIVAVTDAATKVVNVPDGTTIVPVDVVSLPAPTFLTKKIVIQKTANEIPMIKLPDGTEKHGQSHALVIGEVKATNGNGKVLKASDYSSAKFTDVGRLPVNVVSSAQATNAIDGNTETHAHTNEEPGLHTLELNLKEPQVITSIEIYNTHDPHTRVRLYNTILYLYDEDGDLQFSSPVENIKYSQIIKTEL